MALRQRAGKAPWPSPPQNVDLQLGKDENYYALKNGADPFYVRVSATPQSILLPLFPSNYACPFLRSRPGVLVVFSLSIKTTSPFTKVKPYLQL